MPTCLFAYDHNGTSKPSPLFTGMVQPGQTVLRKDGWLAVSHDSLWCVRGIQTTSDAAVVFFVGFVCPTWGNDPFWLVFFKWVESTNYRFTLWILNLKKITPPQKKNNENGQFESERCIQTSIFFGVKFCCSVFPGCHFRFLILVSTLKWWVFSQAKFSSKWLGFPVGFGGFFWWFWNPPQSVGGLPFPSFDPWVWWLLAHVVYLPGRCWVDFFRWGKCPLWHRGNKISLILHDCDAHHS